MICDQLISINIIFHFFHIVTYHLLLFLIKLCQCKYICCKRSNIFLLKTYVSSLEYLKLSLYLTFRFIAQYFMSFLIGECSGSMRKVCGVASLPKYDFNRVAMHLYWGQTLAWVFCEFAPYCQGTSLWEHLNASFAKALLSLIVHFKGTFTLRYHCFTHDLQICNILQLLLIICNSGYICMSCVHNLKLCFFFR